MKLDNRLEFVDISKGLGIIFVVIGHIYPDPISKIIFIFHMPLFFFISGYLFKPRTELIPFFKSKSRQLLIPYAVYLLLIYPLILIDNPIHNIKDLLEFIIRPIFGGTLLFEYTSVFWFITCFFLSQQIFNLIINYVEEKKIPYLMGVLLLLAYLNAHFPFKFPWNANVALMAIPFIYFGYLSREKGYKPNIFIILFICILAIAISIGGYQNSFDMKSTNYGIPAITLFSSLALIYLIIHISKVFSKSKTLANIISLFGRASMVIMYLHQPIQMLIEKFITSNIYIRSLSALIIPLVVYLIVKQSIIGRKYFLGINYA